MVNVYRHFLYKEGIAAGGYNAGFENISILEIANLVRNQIDTEIVVTESNDPRSYRQDSTKLLDSGFKPQYQISDAIKEIINKFNTGDLLESDTNYTVRWMKHLGLSKDRDFKK